MSFFNLKLAISGSTFIDPFVKSEKISCIDTKISKEVSKFEYDSEEANKLRSNTRNELQKLERVMTRVDSVDLSSYEKTCLKDIRVYEKALRKQVKDILQIILQLKKLIENEYLEIIYDLRNPLRIFEHFVQQIKNITLGLEVKKIVGKEIEKIFAEIEASYSKLIDYTFNFIESEFKYYNSIGLNFKSFNNALETDYAFSTHLKNRSKIKQQINGKTQWIKSQIDRLEEIFKDLSKKGILDKNQSQTFLQSTNYFREQFDGLITFGIKRVDVANHMIIEAIVIQKDKHNELEGLKKELKQFYSEFIQDQEKLQSGTESKWVTEQTKKRMMEFKNYEKEIVKEFSEFEKEFTLLIDKVEKEDIEEQRIEQKELKKIEGFFPKFQRNFKRAVATGMLGLALVGYAVPSSSGIGTARDAFVHLISHPISQSKVIIDLKNSHIKDIQQEIDIINKKLIRGEGLSQEETIFVQNIFNCLSLGGIVKHFTEASILINNYVKATGKTIELSPEVYRDSKVVQNAIKILVEHYSNLYKSGQIREGSSGNIDVAKILTKRHFAGGVNNEGQILKGGYLLAEQRNLRLKNTDHRFKLEGTYHISNGEIYFEWVVNSVYDFEDNPDHVTHIPIPGSNEVLKIPDQLSHNMVKIGLAKEFRYFATWTSNHKIV